MESSEPTQAGREMEEREEEGREGVEKEGRLVETFWSFTSDMRGCGGFRSDCEGQTDRQNVSAVHTERNGTVYKGRLLKSRLVC